MEQIAPLCLGSEAILISTDHHHSGSEQREQEGADISSQALANKPYRSAQAN